MRSDLLQETIAIQRQASDPRNSSWVFASAGSGKTKVLVDRLLRLLLDGVLGSKILCVTFTKVAANEMQERILKTLEEWSVLSESDLSLKIENLTGEAAAENLLKTARSLFQQSFVEKNRIKIVTIHSLCQDILRIFPFEAGASPNFEIMDQILEEDFLQKSKGEVFSSAFSNKDLATIISEISYEVSQDDLLSLVANFLGKKEKFFKMKDIFGNIDVVFDKILQNLGLNQDIFNRDNFVLFKQEIGCEKVQDLVARMSLEEDLKATDQKFFSFFSSYSSFTKEDFLEKSRNIFLTAKNDPKKKILTKKFEQDLDLVLRLQSDFIEFYDLENSILTARMTLLALQLVDKILQKYQELKNSAGKVDYNDLISKTQKLLASSQYRDWIRYRLDGFFDHILIDESQDTNEDQWAIIEAISEEFFSAEQEKNRSIFVIGDEKQSIFSFQGSDPDISHQKYDYFKNLAAAIDKKIFKLSLRSSFRSTDEVLSFVDDVFEENSDFIKSDYLKHQAVRESKGLVCLWPRFHNKESDSKEDIKMLNFKDVFLNGYDEDESHIHKKNLASFIAQQIELWVKEERVIRCRSGDEESKKIDFSDIMILLRNQKNGLGEALKEEFLSRNIAFDGDRKINFSDNIILLDIVSILRFVLFAADDLNLASLLKSPFFRVSESRILEICEIKNSLQISIFEAILCCAKRYAEENNFNFEDDLTEGLDYEKDKVVSDKFYFDLAVKLLEVIKAYQDLSLLDFFVRLINDDFKRNFLTEFRQSDMKIIDEFMVFLINLTQRSEINGHEFLKYIDNSEVVLSINQSAANSVRIATIHSAKGLQSPIVIIPDCCFAFNRTPAVKDKLIWLKRGDEFNGSYELPIWLARKKNSSKILDIELKNRAEVLKNEYLRLFYVALTRAENEIYIAGFGNDNDPDSWYNIAKNSINE